MHKLIARTADDRLVMFNETFESSREAVTEWYKHDDARHAGLRNHVQWYAVREVTDNSYGMARVDMSAFVNEGEQEMETLTGREYAEIIGSLQIVRDNAHKQGRQTPDIDNALRKIMAGCTPSTNGLEFRLIDAA